MKIPTLMFLTWLLSSCLDLGSALFFKGLKKHAGYGYGYNSASYGSYPGSYYGSNYNAGYGYGYSQQLSRPRNRQRTGRTYSDIAKVLYPAPHLGLGAGRYLPRAPFAPLWG